MIDRALHLAADALRRHEQAGKKLNEWHHISSAQRKKWVAKATVVVSVYEIARNAATKDVEGERG